MNDKEIPTKVYVRKEKGSDHRYIFSLPMTSTRERERERERAIKSLHVVYMMRIEK